MADGGCGMQAAGGAVESVGSGIDVCGGFDPAGARIQAVGRRGEAETLVAFCFFQHGANRHQLFLIKSDRNAANGERHRRTARGNRFRFLIRYLS